MQNTSDNSGIEISSAPILSPLISFNTTSAEELNKGEKKGAFSVRQDQLNPDSANLNEIKPEIIGQLTNQNQASNNLKPEAFSENEDANSFFIDYKNKFLKTFYSEVTLEDENQQKLIEHLLVVGFQRDKYSENIHNVFLNYHEDSKEKESSNFLSTFKDWCKQKTDKSIKQRFYLSLFNTAILSAIFTLGFFGMWIPALILSISSGLMFGILEGVPKRNIANIGHLQDHLSKKIDASSIEYLRNIYKDRSFEKTKLDEIMPSNKKFNDYLDNPNQYKFDGEKLVDKSSSDKINQGAIARLTANFSGVILSIAFNLTKKFTTIEDSISPVVMNVIGGFLIPIMPILVYFLTKFCSNYRQNNLEQKQKFVDKFADITFNQDSWKKNNIQEVQSSIIQAMDNFKGTFQATDSNGRIQSNTYSQQDTWNNPTKAISFGPWLGAKIMSNAGKKLDVKVDNLTESRPSSRISNALVAQTPLSDRLESLRQ